MIIPEWLKIFLTENAYTLSPEQLGNLSVNSREEFLWKYIVMNVLKPKPPKHSYLITKEGDFFITFDTEYLQVKTY